MPAIPPIPSLIRHRRQSPPIRLQRRQAPLAAIKRGDVLVDGELDLQRERGEVRRRRPEQALQGSEAGALEVVEAVLRLSG